MKVKVVVNQNNAILALADVSDELVIHEIDVQEGESIQDAVERQL